MMAAETFGVGAMQGWIAQVAHASTGALIAAVWQGIVLSLLVATALRLLPKTPAAVRFAIWFGVFVVVAALPSVGLLQRGSVAATSGRNAWVMLDERWCVIVAAAWAIASLVRAVTLFLAVLRVRTLWNRATPLGFADAGVEQTGTRHAQLCVSNEVDRPTVIGFFSPKILIPAWLVEKLSTDELTQIVLHEAGHLSRADDWMNLLQKIALVLFPLNPALAWVERRLCFERELACDERVLQKTGAPKAYAACLASLAEHRLGRRNLALALGALGRESELGRRVRRILSRGERMRPMHARVVLGGAMLGLLAAAAGLERCPQVVGFAPAADGTAVASQPLRLDDGMGSAYRYQAVVFHPPAPYSSPTPMSRMRTTATVDREMKPTRWPAQSTALSNAASDEPLHASPSEPSSDDDRGVTSETAAVRGQQVSASASDSDASSEEVKFQNVEAQAQARSVVQWIVITSWRGDDGSQMVLTSVRPVSPSGVTADGSGATNAVPIHDQVYPYAAVPVRDGWLVIQL